MTEVERTFRVERLPDELGAGSDVRQAYVALDGEVEVRVRQRDGRCTLGVKGGAGLSRTEVEVHIDAGRFDVLWALASGRTVEKVRHEIAVGDLTAEVDRYRGRLEGLCLVEVEFDDEAAAGAFEPPPWFGPEVTDEPGWSNAELASTGSPPS